MSVAIDGIALKRTVLSQTAYQELVVWSRLQHRLGVVLIAEQTQRKTSELKVALPVRGVACARRAVFTPGCTG